MYLAAEQQEVEGKVDGEDQHEERDDDLNGGAFIGRNRQVSGGEAAGARGGEGVNQAVIPRMPAIRRQKTSSRVRAQ